MNKTIFVILISFGLFFMSCEEKIFDQDTEIFSLQKSSSCVSCHIDKDLLAEIADPIENDGGETGDG